MNIIIFVTLTRLTVLTPFVNYTFTDLIHITIEKRSGGWLLTCLISRVPKSTLEWYGLVGAFTRRLTLIQRIFISVKVPVFYSAQRSHNTCLVHTNTSEILRSLGPIDRKFHGHGYFMDLSCINIIKQCSK